MSRYRYIADAQSTSGGAYFKADNRCSQCSSQVKEHDQPRHLSGHVIKYLCVTCLATFARPDSRLRHWTKSQCLANAVGITRDEREKGIQAHFTKYPFEKHNKTQMRSRNRVTTNRFEGDDYHKHLLSIAAKTRETTNASGLAKDK